MKYDIVPAKDHLKCFKNKIGGGSGPTTSVTGGVAQAPSVYNHDTQRRKLQDAAQHKFTPEQLGKLGFVRCGTCVGAQIPACFLAGCFKIVGGCSNISHTSIPHISQSHTHLNLPHVLSCITAAPRLVRETMATQWNSHA